MKEPVAFINVEERKLEWAKQTKWNTPTVVTLEPIPLYTQREWVGLTDEEAAECWSTSAVSSWIAIEAKLKEKNT